jgi:hypothetical protein
MIKLLQLILKFLRNSYTVVVRIKLNLSDSFEVLILNTNITKFLSIISEMQHEQIREHNKSDFFPSLPLQSYPSGVCPYIHLQYCCSKIYHGLPSQKHVKCSRVSYFVNMPESKHQKCSVEYCHVQQRANKCSHCMN